MLGGFESRDLLFNKTKKIKINAFKDDLRKVLCRTCGIFWFSRIFVHYFTHIYCVCTNLYKSFIDGCRVE